MSERTLVYWSLLTVFMFLIHIVLKLAFIELEQIRLHRDVMDLKVMLIKTEYKESSRRLKETLDEAKKRLNIKDEEETDK